MKKLTAGIFATLMVVVSAGVARADIASTEYVNGKLENKESVTNRISNVKDYTAGAATNNTVYPSVAVAEHIAHDVVNGELSDLGLSQDSIAGFEKTANRATSADVNTHNTQADRDAFYTTIGAADEISRGNVDGALRDAGFDQRDEKTGKFINVPYEEKNNIVKTETDFNNLMSDTSADAQTKKESRYMSANAVDQVIHNSVDGALRDAGFDQRDESTGRFINVPYEEKNNIVKTETDFDNLMSDTSADAQTKKESRYMSANAVDQVIHKSVDNALRDAGFDKKDESTGKFIDVPYELTVNKITSKIEGETEADNAKRAAGFPTYELTEQLISERVETIKNENGNAYQPKNDLLTKLSALNTSECNKADVECVLKYNNGTFGLEVITRTGTTTDTSGTQQ